MGFYLRFLRPGKVGEVSIIGVILLLLAVGSGHFIPGSFLGPIFNLSEKKVVWALATYGFIASILPVWMLLCPRDYLSTYMKIGTIGLLAVGVVVMHAGDNTIRARRRPDNSRPSFSVHVHHHCLRRDFGLPFAHCLGHDP
jgi:carbon starvation protein CstA